MSYRGLGSSAQHVARRLHRMGIIALSFLIMLFNAYPVFAENNCQADYHCHDRGRKFRQIAEEMAKEMRVNGVEAKKHVRPLLYQGETIAWLAMMVRPEGPWDHKRIIAPKYGERADIPGRDSDLFLDAWSNIHFGFVGTKAGIPGLVLETGADGLDAAMHHEIYISDRKWIALGISIGQRFEPEQITTDLLISEMLALMPEVAALECDPKNPMSVRPILKNSPTNALLAKARPKIMLVGDSITHGKTGDYTWRYRLHQHLQSKSQGFDFVGPFNGPLDPNATNNVRARGTYAVSGWDDDHDATWGWFIGFEKGVIQDHVRNHQPDLIVVHLGTNDLTWGWDKGMNLEGNSARTAFHMREFIENARKAKPNVQFVISRIGATAPLEAHGAPYRYNDLLGDLANEVRTPESCVGVANVQSQWDWRTDTYDDTHPNVYGEYVVAKAVADEMYNQWNYGAPFGAIPVPRGRATKPTGVRVTPNAINRTGSFTVSWDRVASTAWTEYRVEIRTHHNYGFVPVWRASTTTSALSYTYTGPTLPQTGVFDVVVWAEDMYGRKSMSDPVPLTVGDLPPPPPKPTNIRLMPPVIGQDGGFIATWDRVYNPGIWTTYQVRVHTHHNYGFTPIYTPPDTTSFLEWVYNGPRFPVPGTYDVVVVARDQYQRETMSDPVPLQVQPNLPPPLPPQNVRVNPMGHPVWRSDRFTVSWDRVPNPKVWTTYKLEVHYHRNYGYGLIWESPQATSDTTATYTGPALPQPGTYSIAVVAYDPLNQRTSSEPIDLAVINPPPPPAPTGITIEPANPTVLSPLIFGWTRNQQPGVWTTYRAEIHYHVSYGFGLFWASRPMETTYAIYAEPAPLPQPGTYSIVIVAVDSFGQTTSSAPVNLTVSAP